LEARRRRVTWAGAVADGIRGGKKNKEIGKQEIKKKREKEEAFWWPPGWPF